MRSTKLIVLLAAAASAQSSASSATVVKFVYAPASTLTVKGTTGGATTYVESCPKGLPTGSYSGWESLPASTATPSESASSPASSVSNVALTPIPRPSSNVRRQGSSSSASACEPFTIIQGSEQFEFHMTDPRPNVWTVDQKCSWKGEYGKADITCAYTNQGSVAKDLEIDVSTSAVLKAAEYTYLFAKTAVAVVTATDSASGTPTPTGASASAKPSNFAAGGPAPTGAIAFVGGAAGIFAAALAL
ncbi:hypothetical protein P280DRAFT_465516 [Massarina eburnea CBS 473.64]|uniref:Uncharacterized protein n=1 Tax=Massarina eburnea CBS 473.64 TaxID=1395130 RepID=A0A6A6SDW2_9PLEO|nr:hypothetical protein P280DRAFT_465516 [Massarina eburnea CBS 473.64]